MTDEIYLSKPGYQKLKSELDNLKGVKRKEIAEELKKASEYGDISENSAYDEAINSKAFLESRVHELEKTLKKAKIVNSKKKKLFIDIGCKVSVTDSKQKTKVFYVVTADEADPIKNKITIDSPIGSALHERKIGDKVVVLTPLKTIKYKIIEIS